MKYLGPIVKHTAYKNTNLRKRIDKTSRGFMFLDFKKQMSTLFCK
jgi:hypothetical protein